MNSVERVKEICKKRKIPISKLEKELGFSNGYIGQLKKGVFPADRLEKISIFLGVTTTYLMTGEDSEKPLTPKDEKDIAKRLEETLSDLEDSQSALMFSGEPLDDETRELLCASLKSSLQIGKIKAKQKFTPKKYQK